MHFSDGVTFPSTSCMTKSSVVKALCPPHWSHVHTPKIIVHTLYLTWLTLAFSLCVSVFVMALSFCWLFCHLKCSSHEGNANCVCTARNSLPSRWCHWFHNPCRVYFNNCKFRFFNLASSNKSLWLWWWSDLSISNFPTRFTSQHLSTLFWLTHFEYTNSYCMPNGSITPIWFTWQNWAPLFKRRWKLNFHRFFVSTSIS